MHTDVFWKLIEEAKAESIDCDEQSEILLQSLKNLDASEIVSFSEHLNQKLVDSYRWDLWAVAYLVNGGASDDGFLYFRGWLISQGKEYFNAALKNPEKAADNAVVNEFNECESILYIARDAYEELTREEIPSVYNESAEPAGENWEEENLETIYPQIAEKFS